MDYREYIFENMKTARETEYLKSMYPREAKRMQRVIEDAVDILDYDESMIYDDYPDKLMIRKLLETIYHQLFVMDGIEDEKGKRELVDILVIQDILRRRDRRKGKKYKF